MSPGSLVEFERLALILRQTELLVDFGRSGQACCQTTSVDDNHFWQVKSPSTFGLRGRLWGDVELLGPHNPSIG